MEIRRGEIWQVEVMNQTVTKVNLNSELISLSKSTLNQRHETHLKMEDSTNQKLEFNH